MYLRESRNYYLLNLRRRIIFDVINLNRLNQSINITKIDEF